MVMYLCDCFRCGWFVWISYCCVLGQEVEVGVVEVICCIAKGVDFQFCQKILRDLLKKPIYDEPPFDATLGMKDEDYFGEIRFVECGFDDRVTGTDVNICVCEVSLDETLNYVEQNSVSLRY